MTAVSLLKNSTEITVITLVGKLKRQVCLALMGWNTQAFHRL